MAPKRSITSLTNNSSDLADTQGISMALPSPSPSTTSPSTSTTPTPNSNPTPSNTTSSQTPSTTPTPTPKRSKQFKNGYVPPEPTSNIVAQLISPSGDPTGTCITVPVSMTPQNLEDLVNKLLQNDEPTPYTFTVANVPITSSLYTDIIIPQQHTPEHVLQIQYTPMAKFRVRSVTRCTTSMCGHGDSILVVKFSPDGSRLVTGSGDTTIRVWDLNTGMPGPVLRGHTGWIQNLEWSPDGMRLVSGGMDNTVRVWDMTTNTLSSVMKGHTSCITGIAWEPLHLNKICNRFATASKDNTVRIWCTMNTRCLFVLASHTAPVMSVTWSGSGYLYSGSRDKTIRMWDTKTGSLVHVLNGHGHWVNMVKMSTEFVLRTGCFGDSEDDKPTRSMMSGTVPTNSNMSRDEMHRIAKQRYEQYLEKTGGVEYLASCSDDFTIFLWTPITSRVPVTRCTGHQQPVTHIAFSPCTRYFVSTSFDKSIKIWETRTGKFVATVRGHVGAVYQACWSRDSRMVVTGSRDTTLKLWDMVTRKMKADLPGHEDEVFAVDWCPTGTRVASGGKDKMVKIWKH